MKKQVIKLGRSQLRGLISEAIQSREPGSPLFSLPGDNISERFGAWDKNMDGNENEEGEMVMGPHNFEAAAQETFSIFVDKIVEAFVDTHMEMIEAGMSPESHEGYREDLMDQGLQLKKDLMKVIEQHSDEVVEKF